MEIFRRPLCAWHRPWDASTGSTWAPALCLTHGVGRLTKIESVVLLGWLSIDYRRFRALKQTVLCRFWVLFHLSGGGKHVLRCCRALARSDRISTPIAKLEGLSFAVRNALLVALRGNSWSHRVGCISSIGRSVLLFGET